MTTTKTIHEQMIEAGVRCENHETDLYVPVTPASTAIVEAYEFRSNVTTFRDNIDGQQWYDIPFAFCGDLARKTTEQQAYQYASAHQGFDGTFDDWTNLPADERSEYEDGAAGLPTA